MARSEVTTEFKLVGREYDGGLDMLAESFPRRMVNIVIQEVARKRGPENTLVPTDVHFMPVFLGGDSFFAVRAWHETESTKHKVGVLQPFVGYFDVALGKEDAYLRHRQEVESEMHYKLTTAEAIGLLSLSKVAANHDSVASYVDQEAI